ncbi:MAG: secondary thiamine-phosphate synthase enzyme YjbQ [Candidatus Muiribacteriota bacterium]
MKSYQKEIEFNTDERYDILNITENVKQEVKNSDIKEGFCLVYPLHTTSGIFINDIDSSLVEDIKDFMKKLVPRQGEYRHNGPDEENADGHIRQLLAGHHITLPVSEGNLYMGKWQTVYYAEYDGQRPKNILIKIIGQ